MQVEKTNLEGVIVLTPQRFGDDRGYFSEVWNKARMSEHGLDFDFVQDNHSYSRDKGTVRGLHYQSPPRAQDKLVRCGAGRILDVAVDIRISSPTFGKVFAIELSAENGKQLLVPKGFLHGFSTLTSDCEILYKCTDYYAPECDGSVHFASPDLGIDWQVSEDDAIVSQKDRNAVAFAEFKSPFE